MRWLVSNSLSSCSARSCFMASCSISAFWCFKFYFCAYFSCIITCFRNTTSFFDGSLLLNANISRLAFTSFILVIQLLLRSAVSDPAQPKRPYTTTGPPSSAIPDSQSCSTPSHAGTGPGRMKAQPRGCQCGLPVFCWRRIRYGGVTLLLQTL